MAEKSSYTPHINAEPSDIVRLASEKSCVLGRKILFFGGKEGTGKAATLGENGELIVETAEGRVTLSGGEISVRFTK